ncbi:hypothetical protein [Streptomyces sp. NPDC101115]|uniref:hypothetical protein n=1 Tax=Streptomyces sp. NPDC101115 TaxID=3366106 RepID=UPI0037F40054
MGRQETCRKVYAPLRRAGLEVLEGGVPEVVLPVSVVSATVSCTQEETGRRDAFTDFREPHLIERANRGWYELATSFGLLDANREFLLALPAHRYNPRGDVDQPRRWCRVRLLDTWDVMGAACAIPRGRSVSGYGECLLGSRAGRPEFAMLSLDSTVCVVGTTWQDGIGTLAVPDPGDTVPVRRMIDWEVSGADVPHDRRAQAIAWLRQNTPAGASGRDRSDPTPRPHA